MNKDWKTNPTLKGMNPEKLQMLQNLAEQGAGKNMSDILPFLMSAASHGKENGLNFNSSEQELILDALKQGKTPEERAKLEKIISLLKMIR